MIKIGEKVKELRKKLGITQGELAGEIYSKSFISHIEHDRVSPSIGTLEYLSKMLDTTVSYFLEDSEKNNTPIKNTSSSKELLEKGIYRAENSEFNEAYEIFDDLYKLRNEFLAYEKGLLFYYYGFVKSKLSNSNDSIKHIRNSISIFKEVLSSNDEIPNKSEILIKLGEAYYILNQKDDAIYYFTRALEIENIAKTSKDKYVYVLRNLAILYNNRGMYSNANYFLDKIISLSKSERYIDENVLSAYITQAVCYYNLSEYEKSLHLFNTVIQICILFEDNKRLSSVYHNIATVYKKLEKYDEAVRYSEKSNKIIVNISDNTMKTYVLIRNDLLNAEIMYLKNNSAEAIEKINMIIDTLDKINRFDTEYYTANGNAYMLIGEIYYSMGKYEDSKNNILKAVEYYNKANVLNKVPDAYKKIADIFIKLDEPEQANIYFEKAFDYVNKQISNI